jgi:hypothetical protein
VHFLDTYAGTVTKIADNGEAFRARLQDASFVTEYMHPEKIAELRAAGLNLTPGKCYSQNVPLVLGGQDIPDNYAACDIDVHVDIAGQIHKQVKGLPDGTQIAGINMVKPKERKPWWKIR